MSKITLNSVSDITQATSAQTTINSNSSTVQTAFDNTLSRDGTSPNQMGAALDMNSNQILNLPAPSTKDSPARLVDVASNPTIVVPGTGTSGHTVPWLDGNNTYSGTSTFSGTITGNTTFVGDAYFKSGKPWADVHAFGALGGAHDDTVAIQAAMDYMSSTFGGGIVFFPAGNYTITGTLNLLLGTRLVGGGMGCVSISQTGDITMVNCNANCSHASIEDIQLIGYQSTGATQPVVVVNNGALVNMINSLIVGGNYALSTGGVDGRIYNCAMQGYNTTIFSTGTNFYTACKIDTGFLAGASTVTGYQRSRYYSIGTVGEDHFTDCDFSGSTYTNSVLINDISANNAITTFIGCVFSNPITITNSKATMFSACEMPSAITCGTNPTCITGSAASVSVVVSGSGKILAGNYGIT